MDTIILIFELIGTVAFAVSGAAVGIKKKMDILGVCILGMTVAVGGGIIRDLILGQTPPTAFMHPVYAITSLLVSILIFIPSVRKMLQKEEHAYEKILQLMDSIGLGVFTVVGIRTATVLVPGGTLFLKIFVGVLTGVGGGILRDIMAGDMPYVFIKHFYASASIIGAILCCLIWPYAGSIISMLTGSLIILILRLLAAKYHWSLPKAK